MNRERRIQDFAETASDWFWEMDENLRFSYMSPQCQTGSWCCTGITARQDTGGQPGRKLRPPGLGYPFTDLFALISLFMALPLPGRANGGCASAARPYSMLMAASPGIAGWVAIFPKSKRRNKRFGKAKGAFGISRNPVPTGFGKWTRTCVSRGCHRMSNKLSVSRRNGTTEKHARICWATITMPISGTRISRF